MQNETALNESNQVLTIRCPLCKTFLELNLKENNNSTKGSLNNNLIECMHLSSYKDYTYRWHVFTIQIVSSNVIYLDKQKEYTSNKKPEKMNLFLKPAKSALNNNSKHDLIRHLCEYFSIEEKNLPEIDISVLKIIGPTINKLTKLIDYKESINTTTDLVVRVQGLGWFTNTKGYFICQRLLVADNSTQIQVTLYSHIKFKVDDILHIVNITRLKDKGDKFVSRVDIKNGGVYKLPFITETTNIKQKELNPENIEQPIDYNQYYTIKGVVHSIGNLTTKKNVKDHNIYVGLSVLLVSQNYSLKLFINRDIAKKFKEKVHINNVVILTCCKFLNYRGILAVRTTEYSNFSYAPQNLLIPNMKYKEHLLNCIDTSLLSLSQNQYLLGIVVGYITKPIKCKDFDIKPEEHRYYTAAFIDNTLSCYLRIEDDLIPRFSELISSCNELTLVKIHGLFYNLNNYFRISPFKFKLSYLNKNDYPFTPALINKFYEYSSKLISFVGKLIGIENNIEYTKLFFRISGLSYTLIAFQKENRRKANLLKIQEYYNVYFIKVDLKGKLKSNSLSFLPLTFTPFTSFEKCNLLTFNNDPIKKPERIDLNKEVLNLNDLISK